MNAEAFFAEARKQFGRLSQSQVDGINAILNATEGRKRSHVAYLLATAWHETARTMQPVRETLAGSDAQAVARLDRAWKAGKLKQVKVPYWRFDDTGRTWLGRGYVQLTHRDNYRKAAALVGVDLLGNPSLALRADIAAQILVEGCEVGLFTGKKLADYLPGDYVNARRVVNGLDKANAIAAHAVAFEAALRAGGYGERRMQKTPPAARKPASGAKSGLAAILGLLFAGLAYVLADFAGWISKLFGV